VFFMSGPSVVGNTPGSVSVANPDGQGSFLTDLDAPYFEYLEVLQPYQISSSRSWQFQLSGSVTAFKFTVYVSGSMEDETVSLTDGEWKGALSNGWSTELNWSNNAVPDSLNIVSVLADSLMSGTHYQPQLSVDARAAALRVGYGSTLNLGGFTLRVGAGVDAPGAITSGTLQLDGSAALLSGNLPSVLITGSRSLQGAVKTTGAVSVQDGSLTVANYPLSIQIP
jgi:hypothetical protein